jgi:hypothetical protein
VVAGTGESGREGLLLRKQLPSRAIGSNEFDPATLVAALCLDSIVPNEPAAENIQTNAYSQAGAKANKDPFSEAGSNTAAHPNPQAHAEITTDCGIGWGDPSLSQYPAPL